MEGAENAKKNIFRTTCDPTTDVNVWLVVGLAQPITTLKREDDIFMFFRVISE